MTVAFHIFVRTDDRPRDHWAADCVFRHGPEFFINAITSTLQLRARDDVRGRVIAIYSIGILGSGLVGVPLAGTLADAVGVPDTLLIIATICAGTAAITAWTWLKYQNRKVVSIVQPAPP